MSNATLSNIVNLPRPRRSRPARRPDQRRARRRTRRSVARRPRLTYGYRRRLRRQQLAAIGVGAVAVILTGLSLSHLARGIHLVTGAASWEAWAMAIGIDLGFIALEVAQLCAASQAIGRELSRYARPAVIGTLGASAIMNALAFGSAAAGMMAYPAVLLGLAIPALIYALTQTAFWSAVHR